MAACLCGCVGGKIVAGTLHSSTSQYAAAPAGSDLAVLDASFCTDVPKVQVVQGHELVVGGREHSGDGD